MSKNYCCGQYNDSFMPRRLKNWCADTHKPDDVPGQMKKIDPHLTFIADNRGHLLPEVKEGRNFKPNWGYKFLRIWDLHTERGIYKPPPPKPCKTTLDQLPKAFPERYRRRKLKATCGDAPKKPEISAEAQRCLDAKRQNEADANAARQQIFEELKTNPSVESSLNAFEMLRKFHPPVIWLIGYPQSSIREIRTSFAQALAIRLGFVYLDLDIKLHELSQYFPASPAHKDTEKKRLEPDVSKFDIKRVPPHVRSSVQFTKRLFENKDAVLSQEGVLRMIKIAMVDHWPAKGYIIDCFPINMGEAETYEEEFWVSAAGLYFCSSVYMEDKGVEPEVDEPTLFRREDDYLEGDAEEVCDQFAHKTVKVVNADFVEEEEMEYIHRVVECFVHNYPHTLKGDYDPLSNYCQNLQGRFDTLQAIKAGESYTDLSREPTPKRVKGSDPTEEESDSSEEESDSSEEESVPSEEKSNPSEEKSNDEIKRPPTASILTRLRSIFSTRPNSAPVLPEAKKESYTSQKLDTPEDEIKAAKPPTPAPKQERPKLVRRPTPAVLPMMKLETQSRSTQSVETRSVSTQSDESSEGSPDSLTRSVSTQSDESSNSSPESTTRTVSTQSVETRSVSTQSDESIENTVADKQPEPSDSTAVIFKNPEFDKNSAEGSFDSIDAERRSTDAKGSVFYNYPRPTLIRDRDAKFPDEEPRKRPIPKPRRFSNRVAPEPEPVPVPRPRKTLEVASVPSLIQAPNGQLFFVAQIPGYPLQLQNAGRKSGVKPVLGKKRSTVKTTLKPKKKKNIRKLRPSEEADIERKVALALKVKDEGGSVRQQMAALYLDDDSSIERIDEERRKAHVPLTCCFDSKQQARKYDRTKNASQLIEPRPEPKAFCLKRLGWAIGRMCRNFFSRKKPHTPPELFNLH